MELYDLAEPEMNMPVAVEEGSDHPKKKREPYYQSVSFDLKQLPDLKGVEIGQKVVLHLECEVCGIEAMEKRHTVRLKMKAGGVMGSDDQNRSDKTRKVSEMFKAPKRESDDDYDEDIIRPKKLETKANKFAKQLNT